MWRIYYDNGTTCEDESAPAYGVLCIVDYSSGNRVIHQRSTYYILTGQGWIVAEQDGLIDHILNRWEIIKKVVMGRTIPNDQFWKTYERVKRENPQ